MPVNLNIQTVLAMLIAGVAAAAVAVFARDAQAALITLVAGIASALVAAGTGEAASGSIPAIDPVLSEPPPIPAHSLIEAIIEPVLVVEAGRVAFANQPARTLLGGHIIGEDIRLAIRHPAAAERLTNALPGDLDRPIDLVGLGTLDQRWEMRVSDLPGGQRIVHLIDQTRNYAAERIRVDFVANASHELRTPLASILGFIETLTDDNAADDPAVRRRFLKVILGEAQRMQRLVGDLISLSRIEAEKYRVPATHVDLSELIEEVHAALADTPDQRGRDIVCDIDADVPPVAGDSAQLSQMLHNLIGNAMKYGRPGTPITARLWRDQTGMVRINVSDEGDGIAPEHIPRLTERFYRVDAGRSRTLGGTGLGLAIVKHIVERHRGRLDIASTVGKGTTVSVLLPPASAPAGAAAAQSSPRLS